ncbi:MAG TPA: glycosyl hydrolase 115 family protein [Flavisolibacter sp.]|jgi:hypothetical protein
MKKLLLIACLLFLKPGLYAQSVVSEKNEPGSFPLAAARVAPILVDQGEDSLVHKAAQMFRQDIERVSGKTAAVHSSLPSAQYVIIIGSTGKSSYIQQLVRSGKLKADKLKAQWEGYQVQLVDAPFKGVSQALVIAGSDLRGTAYGVFELSQQMGVSPWYWWADVPVKKKNEIYIKPGAFLADAPKVKYRGIFINDEAPALSGWSREKFGGFNHFFYANVFELMLRLKANYLWPAMWGNAFYDDDPLNRQTAESYGIVIGTSHHEPLMRAHDEWRRYGSGKWNYDSNAVRLKEFWRGGLERATNEKIVTVGMRGDGDEPMTEQTATALLERIVRDQREIIKEVTGKPAEQTPQLWALYKEVQDYYDKGMRVPGDVTLLLCDDNWGNIRKLPKLNERKRKGGYGIYYHFDYVGGPRNYKWLNTNNLARVWEQMHLTREYGADRIWIVNVGDIKPMELPISFFLDYAWNPEKWNEDNLRTYYTMWAEQQFGAVHAKEIGDVLRTYAQLSARRKPELLDASTYNLANYDESKRVLREWKLLYDRAEKVNKALPAEYSDAFFQLALHPVQAFGNLHEMYTAVAINHSYAKWNDIEVNEYADKAKDLYQKDSLITVKYHSLGKGKWNHMMSQTHIGYTYWQQPPVNKMPEVVYVTDLKPRNYGIFERVSPTAIDLVPKDASGNTFYEDDNLVSMEAEHWTRAISSKKIEWKTIPDIGRTGSGVTTFPVTASTQLKASGPRLEYDFYTYDSGRADVHLYFSPTLNFHNNGGLQFAVSIDDEQPVIITMNKEDNNVRTWESWVANNIIIKKSEHKLGRSGKHTLKYWAVSPGVILQKLVVDLGGLRPSYLGPPETKK